MIKHPENCGINHGSRCSCGMSELQAECDRLKEELEELNMLRTLAKEHKIKVSNHLKAVKEENKALRMVIERSDGKSMSAEELDKWISDNAVKGE